MQKNGFVDTHSHLNHADYEKVEEVISRALDANVLNFVVPGWDLPSSERAIELSQKFPGVYAAVGFHPHDASKADSDSLNRIRELSSHDKVVAIGEIGLDYHYNLSPPQVQRKVLEEQIEIAKEVKIPVTLHNRESDSDLLEILERQISSGWSLKKRFDYQLKTQPRGVLHSFNSTVEVATRAIEMGFYLGISGMITFGKKDSESNLQKTVRSIQPEHFLLETDAPYLAPAPHRGKRNEPSYIPLIAEKIATLQGFTIEDMRRCTSYNAYKLFGIGDVPEPRITYRIKDSLYLNLTLRCDSDCIFCDRKGEAMVKGYNLHIADEPSAAQLIEEIADPLKYKEIVFCGYGEPTIRLDVVREVARYVKERGGRTRLDTDGHGSVINHRNILPELQGIIDSVSISLNSIDPTEYQKLMGGIDKHQWQAMIDFAQEAGKFIPEVFMSVVGLNGREEAKTREFVENEIGAQFKNRPLFR
ncbi:MAG TPA: TatD family hydrolase [Candidatus Kryptonia bacterium]